MSTLSRRLFITSSAAAAASLGPVLASGAQETAAQGIATTSVEEALRRRESIRAYAADPLPDATLLSLLWAAIGVNRPDVDGRTAPSARTAYDTEIYVATPDGVSLYDVAAGALVPTLEGDVREAGTAAQRFVRTAPAVLIYASDKDKLLAAGYSAENPTDLTMTGRVNAAIIAQNVYLFAAAEGLGTCLVGGINRVELEAALGFGDTKSVAFIQPVGFPA